MANKITIDELVTKYVLEVDPKGFKDAEKAIDKSAKSAKDSVKSTSKAIEQGEARKVKAIEAGVAKTEKAIKRFENASTRASKRSATVAAKEARRGAAARSRAAALATSGDQKAAVAQLRIAQKAATRQAAAVRRGARVKQRAEVRAQRAIRRASRQTTRVIERESRKQARAARKASKASEGGAGRGARLKKTAGAFKDIGAAAAVAAAAIVGATGAVAAFVNSQTAALDTIAKQSKQAGLGAEEYQRLAFAAERSGTSISAVGVASKKFGVQMLDASSGGAKQFQAALQQIGLSAEDVKGKSFEQQLALVSDAMNQTATDAEKVGLAAKLFGLSAGPEMLPLLLEGASGIKALGDAAGDVFTSDELAPAEAFQDRMTDLKLTVSQAAGRVALELLPAVERAVETFRGWVKENEPLIKEQMPRLREFFSAGAKLAFSLGEAIMWLATQAGDLSTVLETLALAFIAVKLAMVGPAGMVAAAALAGAAIGNLMNSFGASDALERFVSDITGLTDALAALDKQAGGITKKRGAGSELAGGDIKPQADSQEFTKGGKKFSIGKGTLLDIALGEKSSDTLTQAEALNIVAQSDAQEDPGRKDRAARRGKANAAKGSQGGKKKKGGKKRAATGLEAQIDSQIKGIADRAELQASAASLRAGEGSDTAFAKGREAAKTTAANIRAKFDETGELPVGIERDIAQLARSPSVEEAVGQVAPPVISIKNEVTNVTISGNDFTTELSTTLTESNAGAVTPQMGRAFFEFLGKAAGDATRNMQPDTRV